MPTLPMRQPPLTRAEIAEQFTARAPALRRTAFLLCGDWARGKVHLARPEISRPAPTYTADQLAAVVVAVDAAVHS